MSTTLPNFQRNIKKAKRITIWFSRKVTNHQLRATAINHLIDNGFEAREICSVTGQKSEATIENYAKAPSRKRQILMARAISNGSKMPKMDPGPSSSTSKMNITLDKSQENNELSEDLDLDYDEVDKACTQFYEKEAEKSTSEAFTLDCKHPLPMK